MTIFTALAVGCGAALGAMVRYGTDLWVRSRPTWPPEIATLIVNVVGSVIVGALLRMLLDNYSLAALPLWATITLAGFCGGLTTFASLAVQIEQRGRRNVHHGIAIAAGHMVFGFGSAAIAWWLVGVIPMMGT